MKFAILLLSASRIKKAKSAAKSPFMEVVCVPRFYPCEPFRDRPGKHKQVLRIGCTMQQENPVIEPPLMIG